VVSEIDNASKVGIVTDMSRGFGRCTAPNFEKKGQIRASVMFKRLLYPACGWLALCLSGCSMPPVGNDPALSLTQRDQEQRDMIRPEIALDAGYETVSVDTDLPISLPAFSRWFAETGAPRFGSFLVGTEAVPGVVRTEALRGVWNKPADRRRIVLADGNSGVEEIIINDAPHLFRYEVWNLTNTIGRYTSYAIGEFEFSGNEQGTHIRWTYSFRPKVWPDGWFIRSFVHTDFRQFMESALAMMRARAITDLAPK
jgi:hypothetical protein